MEHLFIKEECISMSRRPRIGPDEGVPEEDSWLLDLGEDKKRMVDVAGTREGKKGDDLPKGDWVFVEATGDKLCVVRGVADSLKIITRQAGLTFGEYAFHYAKTHGSHTYKLLSRRCTSQVLRSAFKKMRIYVHRSTCLLIHAADVEDGGVS
ncbi:3-isopropylmalate dehydrogenase [Nymphaea thermarum]|nr:3-isopropylmalate dehydrogenase [Nymphaea thermarum]